MNRRHPGREGFSLIELMVVIGIIAILSGVMLATFGGASDSANSARCMTNMRNLAVAAHNFAMVDGNFPAAGSYAYRATDGVHERTGWISWVHPGLKTPFVKNDRGRYPRSSQASASWRPVLAYQEGSKSDMDRSRYALTNGCVWAHAGRSSETYVCPLHKKELAKKKYVATWSYVMNSYFGCADKNYSGLNSCWRSFSGLRSSVSSIDLSPDRVLLLAEVPFASIPRKFNDGGVQRNQNVQPAQDEEFDGVLRYDSGRSDGGDEIIGFNHRQGKSYAAHVAFADGHVSALTLPRGMSEGDARNLTTWLCQGDEISFNGSQYERTGKADPKTN